MGREVTVELWLGENPGDPFVQVSLTRCVALLEVEEGRTVKELFEELSSKCRRIGDLAFEPNSGRFRADIVVVKNDRLVSKELVLQDTVSPGDSIRIVPLYMGG